MTLDGKVAIVTGAGTGIGLATAALFAAKGARVALFGRREGLLADAAAAIRGAGGTVMHVAGDVAREPDVARLVQSVTAGYGGVDVLVNAAAVRAPAAFTDITPADFESVLRTNLLGAFVVTRAVVASMRARGGGSVVHIGSALGTVAVPLFAPYIASKGGLHMLARAAAVELIADTIRVNVVAPGTIDAAASDGVSKFRRGMLAYRIPAGRAGHVDDVAQACLYLASDAARYVTGSVLAVDGGWTAS